MDDCEAIRRCRAGDKEAFRHLVDRYQRQALGHATAILGNREDARDASQEAFLDVYQALDRFDLSRAFYPWFYVLLRHRCFKLAAGARRHETQDLETLEILAPQTNQSREASLSLEVALQALSAEERELITLKHLDGLSYAELAERLEIPTGTVMSRLYHARRKLAAKLKREFHRKEDEL
jgi:RNA polymerase sigma-70 factor (ECF subfamily)